MRPLIGITSDYSNDTNTINLNSDYYWAIYRAGGHPVVIPYTDSNDIHHLISILDGIMFTGGNDIDPGYYGELPIQSLGELIRSGTSLN